MRRTALPPLLMLALSIGSLGACGDDSDSAGATTTTSAQQAYCADADQLRSDLSSLTDLDVVADGTDAVTAQFDALEDDLSALKSSAGDAASPEISDFETSLDDLQSAIGAVSGDLTVANASGVVAAVQSVATTGTAVVTTLDSTCS
jgi:hypothetical protein